MFQCFYWSLILHNSYNEQTEEDLREKEEIELLATRIMDPNPGEAILSS
jgi:hypothetical protein